EMGISPYIHGRSNGSPERGPHNNPAMPQFGSRDVDNAYDMAQLMHNYTVETFGINGGSNHGGIRNEWDEVDDRDKTYVAVHANGYDDNRASYCPGGALITSTYYTIFLCQDEVDRDVFGHEYGHGISNWGFPDGSGLALGVDYDNHSAASLAESFSDVVGEGLQGYGENPEEIDWMAGSFITGGIWRDLVNPHEFVGDEGEKYAARAYDEHFDCGQDPQGYYLTSTVFTKAMQLTSEGGEFNGCEVASQGIDFVNQIYFRAWRTKFSRSQDFETAYDKFMQACYDLAALPEYTEEQCEEFRKALQAVEVDQLDLDYGQGGLCVAGPQGEQAPPCAVNNAGTIWAVWPNGSPANFYARGEEISILGLGGVAGKEVNILLVHYRVNRPVWDDLNAQTILQTSAAVDAGGIIYTDFMSSQMTAQHPGVFDIVVDGNKDGRFQPWADSVVKITIADPQDNDDICYRGQSYPTSENCFDSENDCACGTGKTCTGEYVEEELRYSCKKRRQILDLEAQG
ncbi:MAG: M4 family metallopeptidase, partial [Bdellovibrionales bacterium]|nr:M4 family metallopeptidase [Bdellovibrionales bacterium]